MIALIDHDFGHILAALVETGQMDNTLVIFTSDHGEMLGNHQQRLKGPQLYDDLTRVLLILRWPDKIPAGGVVADSVQWIDLTATILNATGSVPGAVVTGQL